MVLTWPWLLLMHTGNLVGIFLGQLAFCLLIGIHGAVNPVIIAEIFPAARRSSAASVTCNVTLAAAGGTAPVIAVWLIDTTGDPMVIVFYMILASAISAAAVLSLRGRDTADTP